MRQLTLATTGFDRHAKTTRRAAFLAEMDQVVPWRDLCVLIEPVYPKPGNGRPPIGLERMLRVYFLQQWFNLSDPGVEEALYESLSMRRFADIDLGREPVPDETTVCKFRHLLERHDLGRKLFEQVHLNLEARGLKVATGTIVDATIINAPSSTKNAAKERDPEMRQTRKGNQWYFGMKAHIGVDSKSKLIHPVVATRQYARRDGAARSAARRRDPRMGRSGLKAKATSFTSMPRGEGLYQSPHPASGSCR
jgi:IS5 family transposase